MLLTGIGYTLVGIKNRWVHTFFSTAYLASLGIAVLIIYVMSLPVSNAVQGGYVVAIVMAGCAIGAASTFFKELTEGLGCALGGFCLSMWLLCLVPGGLLQSVASKAIFISCFTLVGFAFYFSRFTRDWALIVTIAFGGSTVTVLGIDCFSRAGLKEFWAYVWELNDDLFPLGAVTYPVTKGIRVETAAIIILCLIGIISQIKLWRIVRDRREKRAAERAEGQRNLEEEEENVGRQIEETNRRDRREWERVYGNGTVGSTTASHYSVGDDSSEKHLRGSYNYSNKYHSGQGIEMADMSESSHSQRGQDALIAEEVEDGKVTVRVIADDVPEGYVHGDDESINEKGDLQHDDATLSALQGADKRASKTSSRGKRQSRDSANSRRNSRQKQIITPAPEVVPLPFTVPAGDEAASNRSSVATFADEDEKAAEAAPARSSLVKRLSQGSATLLRSFSQRSARTVDNRLDSGESSEELVEPAADAQHDDNQSLAANIDDESVSGIDARSIASPRSKSIEITAELADKKMDGTETQQKRTRLTSQPRNETIETGVAHSPETQYSPEESVRARSEKAQSVTSGTSTPASLTKGRLPQSLSRVAMSYRTNEWAKHLSNADTPDLDELHISQPAAEPTKVRKERVKPVDVTELQRTAEEGVPPAIRRSESRTSQVSAAPSAPVESAPARRDSQIKVEVPSTTQERDVAVRSPTSPMLNSGAMRSSSALAARRNASGILPIAEEHDGQDASQAAISPATIPEDSEPPNRAPSISPSLQQYESSARAPASGIVSYASPQTLIGQREMVLRSRSQGNLANIAGPPSISGPASVAASDAGSLHDYSMYAAALVNDPDDMPLSQRKEMMRSNSRLSLGQSSNGLPRVDSSIGAENFTFNSHQPQRSSGLPTPAAREAQLANFRMSVSQDLRAGNAMMTPSGRETPFASTNSLLGGREAEIQRNIEMQRHVMMGQKEAEAQRRDSQRREREFSDRLFDERMRSGDMLEAHREAMRKMQRSASKH